MNPFIEGTKVKTRNIFGDWETGTVFTVNYYGGIKRIGSGYRYLIHIDGTPQLDWVHRDEDDVRGLAG